MAGIGGTFYWAAQYGANPSDPQFEIVATFPGYNAYYDYDATNDYSLISGTPTASGDLRVTSAVPVVTPEPATFGLVLLGIVFVMVALKRAS